MGGELPAQARTRAAGLEAGGLGTVTELPERLKDGTG